MSFRIINLIILSLLILGSGRLLQAKKYDPKEHLSAQQTTLADIYKLNPCIFDPQGCPPPPSPSPAPSPSPSPSPEASPDAPLDPILESDGSQDPDAGVFDDGSLGGEDLSGPISINADGGCSLQVANPSDARPSSAWFWSLVIFGLALIPRMRKFYR